jgi:hypothetical protein
VAYTPDPETNPSDLEPDQPNQTDISSDPDAGPEDEDQTDSNRDASNSSPSQEATDVTETERSTIRVLRDRRPPTTLTYDHLGNPSYQPQIWQLGVGPPVALSKNYPWLNGGVGHIQSQPVLSPWYSQPNPYQYGVMGSF